VAHGHVTCVRDDGIEIDLEAVRNLDLGSNGFESLSISPV
jgi:hypothetical protein